MTTTDTSTSHRPGFWARMSIGSGNLVQLVGLMLGTSLLYAAANLQDVDAIRVALMLAGFLVIYDCCHAIAHWAVGRVVGIRFRGYGLRGTDHPETYPPGIRHLMGAMPFFTAMTQKDSMREASPMSRALMFAGETATTIFSLLAAFYAWQSGIPGGNVLFWVTMVWNVAATVTTTVTPRGDYAKALRALRAGRQEGKSTRNETIVVSDNSAGFSPAFNQPSTRTLLRTLAPSLLINAVLPFVLYRYLTGHDVSTVSALSATAIFPVAGTALGWIRTRRLDMIGVISLFFIALGLATSFVSGSPLFFLVKESFLTGLFGLAYLASLLLPRPLMFYLSRQFVSGSDPTRAAQFENRWQHQPSFRSRQRLITVVWGCVLIVEALIRLALAFILPIPLFLVVSPVIAYVVITGLIIWSISYARRHAAQHNAEMRAAP